MESKRKSHSRSASQPAPLNRRRSSSSFVLPKLTISRRPAAAAATDDVDATQAAVAAPPTLRRPNLETFFSKPTDHPSLVDLREWSHIPRIADDGSAPYVWLAASPFANRQPTLVFQPRDKPAFGSPITRDMANTVEPVPMKPATTLAAVAETCASTAFYAAPVPISGFAHVKRLGKRGAKYGDLKVMMAAGAVRFSSVVAILARAGLTETQDPADPNWVLRWAKRVELEDYASMRPYQKINHFPGTWGIGRKDNLHRRLTSLMKRFSKDEYWFVPAGFLLPRDLRAMEIDYNTKLLQLKKDRYTNQRRKPLYILKRVASACGRGMKLISRPPSNPKTSLVQEYIDDPLLINGKKFDLRIYVVVTSFNPLRAYVYREGLARFASSPYPVGPRALIKCRTAHLTNFSVNVHNKGAFQQPQLVADEDDDDEDNDANEEEEEEGNDDGDNDVDDSDAAGGSKWTFDMLRTYFASNALDWDGTWSRIDEVIIKTLLAVEGDVNEHVKKLFQQPGGCEGAGNCFELFGFDVLLRANLTPMLMEVNIMPSLQTDSSDLDQHVKANMIAEMLTLVGIHGVNPKYAASDDAEKAVFPPEFASAARDIIVAEEEFARRGHFRRIFPIAGGWTKYKPFFAGHRPINADLCRWEESAKPPLSVHSKVADLRFQFGGPVVVDS